MGPDRAPHPLDSRDDLGQRQLPDIEGVARPRARDPPADQSRGLVELSPARGRLRAALAAVLVQATAPELALVHRWARLVGRRGSAGGWAPQRRLRPRPPAVRGWALARLVLLHRLRSQHPRRFRMGANSFGSHAAGRVGCVAACGAEPVMYPTRGIDQTPNASHCDYHADYPALTRDRGGRG